MKKQLIIIINLFVCSVLFAQQETQTWQYNLNNSESKIENQYKTTLLKKVNKSRSDNDLLGTSLQKAIINGNVRIYSDKECLQLIKKENVRTYLDEVVIDTIITHDYETFEDASMIVETQNVLFPHEKTVYEITNDFRFNPKKQQIEMTVQFVHIYLEIQNWNTNTIEKKYLFSFKIQKETRSTNEVLDDPNIIWATEIQYNFELKNEDLIDVIFNQKHLDKHSVYSSMFEPMNPDINKIFMETNDTITTFDMETFEEKMKIVKTKLNKKNFKIYRVLQDLYFDKSDNQLKVKFYGIAPLQEIYDENGNFIANVPLFCLFYEKGF